MVLSFTGPSLNFVLLLFMCVLRTVKNSICCYDDVLFHLTFVPITKHHHNNLMAKVNY